MAAGPFYYLYGVTAQGIPSQWDLAGIGSPPAPVTALEHGDLAVVISPVADPVVDPSRINAAGHERVVTGIMAAHTIIPFALGHVMPLTAIRHLLDATRAQCHELLALFDGKIEVGLKAYWRKEAYLPDIETPEIRALTQRVSHRSGPEAEAVQAQVGALVQEATEAKRAEYLGKIYEPLADAAVAARLGDTLVPRMIFNAAFLVERSCEEQFDQLVNAVAALYLDQMEFSYTGPWPPYHFVTLHIQLQQGEGAGAFTG